MAGVETAAMNSTDVSLAAFDGQQVLWTVAANTLLHEVGVPLPMTPTVLVAGANAVSGTFDPFLAILAIVAVVAATLIGNSLWFAAGRRYGMGGLKQLGRFSGSSDAFISRAENAVGRWGGSSLVIGRFVPGVSLLAPPLAGALGMRWSKFLMLTTAGASLYGVVVVTAECCCTSRSSRHCRSWKALVGTRLPPPSQQWSFSMSRRGGVVALARRASGRTSRLRQRCSGNATRYRAMSFYGLLSFCAIYALAVASPGPAVAAVLARSLGHGMRGAPAFIAGLAIGDLIWFGIAAAGLAALAQVAHTAFVVIKYAGAAYLLYLAYRLWTAPAQPLETSDIGSLLAATSACFWEAWR